MNLQDDDEDSNGFEKIRCDNEIHRFVQSITESTPFNGGIMFIILLNALFVALETDGGIRANMGAEAITAIDCTFLALYTVEFILKVYAEPIGYWKMIYNIFDFGVLGVSFVQVIYEWTPVDEGALVDERMEAVRILRAARTLRTLRTVSFIRGLQVLVSALLMTIIKWVVHIILLLVLLMFLFAIIGYYFFGYQDISDKENWGRLDRAMLTLFSFVTVDGWTDIQGRLDALGYVVGGRIYTIMFIIIGHFIFTNVFIGVIIMNISEAAENFKTEQKIFKMSALEHKKNFMMMRQHTDVTQMLARQKHGKYSNFEEMVYEFQKGLRHDEGIVTSELCTNLLWMEAFIRTLDHMDNTMYSIQQLHFEMANTLSVVMETRLKKKYGT